LLEACRRLRSELKEKYNCNVVALVADNAANLQALVKVDDIAKALGPTVPLVHRCACHVVQLMVHDIEELWMDAFNKASEHQLSLCTVCSEHRTKYQISWTSFNWEVLP
jgi:hypothetical protein